MRARDHPGAGRGLQRPHRASSRCCSSSPLCSGSSSARRSRCSSKASRYPQLRGEHARPLGAGPPDPCPARAGPAYAALAPPPWPGAPHASSRSAPAWPSSRPDRSFAAASGPHGADLASALVGLAVLASLAYLAWNIDPAWLFTAGADRLHLQQQLGEPRRARGASPGPPDPGRRDPGADPVLAGRPRSPPVPGAADPRAPGAHRRLGDRLRDRRAHPGRARASSSTSSIEWRCPSPSSRSLRWRSAPLATGRASSPQWCGSARYLGLTAFFEIVGPHQLVFPHFILNTGWGTERAQGPFIEPSVNGLALYMCAVSSVMALGDLEGQKPIGAGTTLFLCVLGLLFTLTRSAWVAAIDRHGGDARGGAGPAPVPAAP